MSYILIFNLTIWFIFLYKFNTFRIPTNLKWSAASPFNFYLLFNLIFTIDFLYFYYANRHVGFYENSVHFHSLDIEKAYFFYSLCFLSSSLGLLFGIISTSNKKTPIQFLNTIDRDNISKKLFNIFIFIFILCFLKNYHAIQQIITGSISKQMLFREFKNIHILFSFIPAFFAFRIVCSPVLSKENILSFFTILCFYFFSDSRGGLILVSLIYLTYFNDRVKKIPLLLIFPLMPFLAYLLVVLRYIFREAWRNPSFNDFINEQGGFIGVFFGSVEISVAELITTILKWPDSVERFPFESFFAGIMFPLPRSIFSFKPLGAGGAFTEEYSPLRWELTRSEIITTGFGDLILQFGPYITPVIAFLLFFIFGYLIHKSLLTLKHQVLLLPFLGWWIYIFLRSGVFNMFGSIWSYSFVAISVLIFSKFRWFAK